MIDRALYKFLAKDFRPGVVWVLVGARRTGKTVLISEYLKEMKEKKIFSGQGEDLQLRSILESCSQNTFRQAFNAYDIVFLDEVQKIPNCGEILKLLVDTLPDKRIVVTGSSAFFINQSLGQPLTGRKQVYKLYPIIGDELMRYWGGMDYLQRLSDVLIYGSYPNIITMDNYEQKKEFLYGLVEDYLYQDILELDKVRSAKKIKDLLLLIAYQVGKEVSYDEIGKQLLMSKDTVKRYLDLLEKCFVLHRLGGFSKNLRKEVTKSSRYFFVDNGIRNALIQDFRPVGIRNDMGALWENYFIMERIKQNSYRRGSVHHYFWRTYQQEEIDLIEWDPENNSMNAFECKYSKSNVKPPKAFTSAYPDAIYQVATPQGMLDYMVV